MSIEFLGGGCLKITSFKRLTVLDLCIYLDCTDEA